MIVFWKGWGWLVVVVFIVPLLLTQLLIDAVGGRGAYSQHSGIYGTVATLAGAVMVWVIGRYLNQRDSPGATANAQVAHTFMFLRMEYWAVLFVVFAVANILS
jgi:hypothetical protein